ncbi:hypothetical protein G3I30_02665 [Actinospica acidiphila]|nr:hypothetical protein [Actinospica acidiphila]
MAHSTHTAPLTLPDGLCSADASVTNPDCARSREFMWVTPDGQITMQAPADADTAREHTEQPAGTCPVYRDCTETTPGHYDHHSRITVDDDTDGTPILDAGMVGLSGDDDCAVVYLRNADYTDAASLKAKTAELRRFLDRVDAMADRVFTDHQARG